jgi:hypothetical protein
MIRKLNSFFFDPVPVSGVARMRILIGLILVIQTLTLLPALDDFFGPGAFVTPSSMFGPGSPHIRLIEWWGGGALAVRMVFGIHLIASLSFLAGFFTRTSGVIAYLTLVSIHHQNLTILNSGDTALRFALFFLILAPSGALWSIDARNHHRKNSGSDQTPSIPKHAPWALRMIQLQTSAIYLFTSLSKVPGQTWFDGTAVYYATRLWDFERFGIDPLFNSMAALKILSWTTLALEFALGTLIWIPTLRIPLILCGIGFHLGIEFTMNIPWFEWVMITLLIGMWPTNRTFFPLMSRRTKSSQS